MNNIRALEKILDRVYKSKATKAVQCNLEATSSDVAKNEKPAKSLEQRLNKDIGKINSPNERSQNSSVEINHKSVYSHKVTRK